MSVNIEETPLWAPISDIMNSGKTMRYSNIIITIHTEQADHIMPKFLALDIIRDYENAIGDEVYVTVLMGLGDYINDIYPFKENLECSVRFVPVDKELNLYDEQGDIEVRRYKAIFLADENPKPDSADVQNIDRFSLNTKSIVTVKFQLVERALETLRTLTCGGVYKARTNEEVVGAVMADNSHDVEVEGSPVIEAIDIVPGDNEKERETTVIPQETLLTDLPTYIQQKEGGLYNAGVGNYLQKFNGKTTWFIYPLFNNKRFEEDDGEKDRLVIYSVPKARFHSTTKTFKKDFNTLYLLSSNEKETKNDGEARVSSDGVGFKMADADAMMTKPVDATDEGPIGKRENLTYEVNTKDKSDNVSLTPLSENNVSSNPFKAASEVMPRVGAPLFIEWAFADHELLYPAMPVKYIFLNDTAGEMERVEVFGTLLKAQYTIQQNQPGWSNRYFITIAGLGIFVDKVVKGEEKEEDSSEGDNPISSALGSVKSAVNTAKSTVSAAKSTVNTAKESAKAAKSMVDDAMNS